jgi:hypothetical protein
MLLLHMVAQKVQKWIRIHRKILSGSIHRKMRDIGAHNHATMPSRILPVLAVDGANRADIEDCPYSGWRRNKSGSRRVPGDLSWSAGYGADVVAGTE